MVWLCPTATLRQFVLFRLPVHASRFHTTAAVNNQDWRIAKRLHPNKTAEGVLTDAPDYKFTDGRVTPMGSRQKYRMTLQRLYAAEIVKLSGEIDFAVKRHKRMQDDEKAKRQNILDNRLKPKGEKLLN